MKLPSDETQIAIISTDIGYMRKSIESLEKKFDDVVNNYVQKKDHEPVVRDVEFLKKFVWTATGGLLVLSFVLKYVL